MTVIIFRKNPVEFKAIQFDGTNFGEIREFTGIYVSVRTGNSVHVFNPIGTFIPDHQFADQEPRPTAELWVEANRQWLPIEPGEWIVQDQLGFYPCKDEIMKLNNTPVGVA